MAKVVPQLPAPPCKAVARENGCGAPPPKVNVPPARATLPVLVMVRVLGPLGVPMAWLPNASVVGLTENALTAGTLVPVSATGEPVTVVPVTFMVAVPV